MCHATVCYSAIMFIFQKLMKLSSLQIILRVLVVSCRLSMSSIAMVQINPSKGGKFLDQTIMEICKVIAMIVECVRAKQIVACQCLVEEYNASFRINRYMLTRWCTEINRTCGVLCEEENVKKRQAILSSPYAVSSFLMYLTPVFEILIEI